MAIPNLIVPKLKLKTKQINSISNALDKQEKYVIANAPWKNAFPYQPDVRFTIAQQLDCIVIKYWVTEKYIRAINTEINSSVWEDTCVEFFVSFDEKSYYNIECNCLGTLLIGYKKNDVVKERLPNEQIATIETLSKIHKNPKTQVYDWTMTWRIPIQIFVHTPNLTLSGLKCRGNFYKCGDKLPEPHYLAWANIEFEKPNFHLPDFFGNLIFT